MIWLNNIWLIVHMITQLKMDLMPKVVLELGHKLIWNIWKRQGYKNKVSYYDKPKGRYDELAQVKNLFERLCIQLRKMFEIFLRLFTFYHIQSRKKT